MRKILVVSLVLFACGMCYSQDNVGKFSWYGEIHSGLQATLNDNPYTAQIKPGYDTKPFDSSRYYSAYFKNQLPVELVIGAKNKKGLQYQFNAAYYVARMALSNTVGQTSGGDYLLGKAHLIALSAFALLDYNMLNGNYKSKIHFMGGVGPNIIIPANISLDPATSSHFGISAFEKNISFNVDLKIVLNIDINEHFYVANSLAFTIPVSGNMGKIQMSDNSAYSTQNPVKTNSIALTTGIGFHL
ncbi:MAG: hypothetical protein JST87_03380 [Bacteroidetes bacterium]|nr:hypothetical protein [Bacteroidota bacterium]